MPRRRPAGSIQLCRIAQLACLGDAMRDLYPKYREERFRVFTVAVVFVSAHALTVVNDDARVCNTG